MNTTRTSFNSLKTYFGEKKLKLLSVQWLDKYTPLLNDEQLCELFEDVFGESASYFEINGNAKAVAEKLMVEFYHNEAFIKSSVINLLKKEKNVTFFEMPLLDSRIDVCSINGHSCAYEIKTSYDTVKRLKKQVNDYLRVFEFVYVVCPIEKVKEIIKIVPDCVGVFIYEDKQNNGELSTFRAPTYSMFIDSSIQFNLLHKNEKTEAISLLNDDAKMNDYFKNCLKKRYSKKWRSFKRTCSAINRLDYQYRFSLC